MSSNVKPDIKITMQQELSTKTLISEWIQSSDLATTMEHRTLHINDYVDRQLKHLVITQEFDFSQIGYMLAMMFPECKARLSRRYCEERWTQLHLVRKHKIDEKLKQSRKMMAVIAFEDPRKFLTARQLVKQLEIEQEKRLGKQAKDDFERGPRETFEDVMNSAEKQQFDITKDKVKRISPQKFKAMETEYLAALENAREVSEDMLEKPFVYRPKFIVDNKYELQREDLTQEKAREIASSDMMPDSKVVGAFQEFNQQSFKSKFREEPEKPMSKPQGIFGHLVDQNWSDYESDDDS